MSLLGNNIGQLCKNLGISLIYAIPLYAARFLSTLASLQYLTLQLLQLGILSHGVAHQQVPLWRTAATMLWASVACYLSFTFTDGLLLRWLFHYGPRATIIRLLSLNAFNYYISTTALTLPSGRPSSDLPVWILLSLVLTAAYIVQDWLTSNLAATQSDGRALNLIEIAVFCVVPVGMASFITMCLMLIYGNVL
ncbi:N-glycosylation protein-domain-containing protein [Protomyces lactucae-debilis]|uniref:N-glycosylation protein-domain-containing protein n=1 Tax=Protomyces lactucae-debilis TaxID=2754530 RepID=A0A1Y2FJT2_PROLT|nr:N-glycosylation protein-domain-containing protein [Protomyces lactucae-debilis]ORY84200.1 N-glycosylation protein-domain-containing protein [Protomyces lactucae-debilis]